jgi:hypothetical protein
MSYIKIKTGKEEIAYLLKKSVEKYQLTTGHRVICNTNPKNYEDLAKVLSEISNELPHTAQKFNHEPYSVDNNPKKVEYPHRKYDITGVQIKDAYLQMVANPRAFLIDACYIYLYQIGRKGFEEAPQDEQLIEGISPFQQATVNRIIEENTQLHQRLSVSEQSVVEVNKRLKNQKIGGLIGFFILLSLLIIMGFIWFREKKAWTILRTDLAILPYQPTSKEIDKLVGVWMYYTGAPQARANDPNRYHMVVNNLVEITYKNGYFIYNRHGANIDHIGYMQFESPAIVSIHSHVKNNSTTIESPIHALIRLDKNNDYLSSIATTWSFDTGEKNDIIGLRNVFIKLGKEGTLEEVINTPENAKCHCKIFNWIQPDKKIKTFQLKYSLLDSLSDEPIKKYIDEKSILLREPQQGIILSPK